MSGAECTRCTAPSGNYYLCSTCAIALRIDLGDVAGFVPDSHGRGGTLLPLGEELTITACRLDKLTDGGVDPDGLPYKPLASEALWVLRSRLAAWVAELADVITAEMRSTVGMAGWLHRNLDLLRSHEQAAQAHDELVAAVREARRIIDRPTDRRMFLGRCGAPQQGRCAEELYGLPWMDTVTCPACDDVWSISDRRAWMLRTVEDEVRTIPTLAALLTQLGVPVGVEAIQRWAKTGRLHWISMDSSKRRRYRAGDVLDLALGGAERGNGAA